MEFGQFTRTELILGHDAVEKLSNSRVIVFGIGGVGGYAIEALARSGVGTIDIVDNDMVDITNINRQIIALHSTIGMKKTLVMAKRLLDINPDIIVNRHDDFYLPENSENYDFGCFDYIVDCIDTVTAKIELAVRAKQAGIPIISSMGTGNKTDPSMLKITDIYSTQNDPLARVMRHELRKRNIESLKVVYSEEKFEGRQSLSSNNDVDAALKPCNCAPEISEMNKKEAAGSTVRKRAIPGSTAFVPPVAGLFLASEVVHDLIS